MNAACFAESIGRAVLRTAPGLLRPHYGKPKKWDAINLNG